MSERLKVNVCGVEFKNPVIPAERTATVGNTKAFIRFQSSAEFRSRERRLTPVRAIRDRELLKLMQEC